MGYRIGWVMVFISSGYPIHYLWLIWFHFGFFLHERRFVGINHGGYSPPRRAHGTSEFVDDETCLLWWLGELSKAGMGAVCCINSQPWIETSDYADEGSRITVLLRINRDLGLKDMPTCTYF